MKRSVVPAALVLCVLALAGCTFQPSSNGSTSEPYVVVPGEPNDPSQPDRPKPDKLKPEKVKPEQSKPGTADGTATEAENDRQVITTGSATITVDNPAEAADDAVRIVEGAGGRIDGLIEKPPIDGDQGSAQLTVRIPAAKLIPTLDAIKKLGIVETVEISKQDVTTQTEDLAARITALRASVTRLIELMSKATTTADLITIESALSQRQADLESFESQQRSLVDQVEFSTIMLNLGSKDTAPLRTPDSFLSGLIAGWNALVAFFAGVVVVVGVLLPWLILLAIVAGAVLLIVRRRRKRSGAAKAAP